MKGNLICVTTYTIIQVKNDLYNGWALFSNKL